MTGKDTVSTNRDGMPVKIKRGRGKRLDLTERNAIVLMREKGVSVSQIARNLDRSREAIQAVIDEARDYVKGNALEYAQLHLQAAKKAAADGNARPAEWALERLKVVDPVKVEPNQGFTVNIGVLLPGLGSSAGLVSRVNPLPQVVDNTIDSAD